MTISDIVSRVYFLTKTNSTSFPAADMLISVNNALNHVNSLILKADDKWQFDDSNQTDLPTATASLVSGQQDYSIPATYLSLDRVRIKDSGGIWHLLDPIDIHDQQDDFTIAYFNSSGLPTQYDKSGTSVFLGPIPNYNLAAALEIRFTRGPAEFTSAEVTTGTKSPGFPSLFHDLVPTWVAYDYAVANGQKTAQGFLAAIQLKEQMLNEFIGSRNRDYRPRFTVSTNGTTRPLSGRITMGSADSNI